MTGFQHLGFEVIPFKKTREAVLAHVPRHVPLTITASPAKGQDATIDLAVELTGDGYSVSPHLSAQQVRDPKIIARWARQLTRRGIDLPVYVGVPGAVTRQKLLRVSGGLGIGESAKFLKKQQSLLWRFFVPGGYRPDKIIRGLAPHLGEPDNHLAGFHVFTFNDLEPTEEWRQQAFRRFPRQASASCPVRPDVGRPDQERP